ncbi:histidine phosphatase family protein [Candidatus Parcubacteria bacterium]|nr:histidine phosphatase family protein [Candidatus Parcubacteria bacterium]
MAQLILLRHLKSQWNLENRFSGWVDVPLCQEGTKKAKEIAEKVFKFKIDIAYSSPLIRNQNTLVKILDYVDKKYPIFIYLDKGKMKKWGDFKEIHEDYLQVYISENLNERYYGKLQGLNKQKIIKKYGRQKVHLWRRSFEECPPDGESLKDTYKRTVPFYKKYIERDLRKGKNVLIVSSHNSLRAIIKYIEKISDQDIIDTEVPFAGIICYKFDKSLKLKEKNSFEL